MIQATKNYFRFLWRCARIAFVGDWRYYTWMGALSVLCLLGLNAYCKQFAHGLITTGMSDEVSWGVYIANFTFLVGVAAAAVMMVIPVYIYDNEELHDLVIFGELLAVAAIIMCLLFVTVDLGRPDRFWHLIPGIGQFNFPASMLSWDVIVLNGYLVLNIHICGYLLYCRYQKKMPAKWFYVPFVFIAIFWAISIHTVTAFLYVGLGGRPFWNSSIVGPRFLASAFTAGPALIILAIQVVRRVTAIVPTGDNAQLPSVGTKTKAASSRAATMADLDLLASFLPELKSVSAELKREILPTLTVLEVEPGTVLLRQGETEKHAFFVLKGRVVVEREESGRHRITRSARPGEQFGEVSALAGTPRMATAIAEEATQVLRVPAEALRKLMKSPAMDKLVHARMSERLMITDRALMILRGIVQVSMLINVFLLVCEVFKEFYSANLHSVSAKYLFVGLHGHHALVPWIWTAIALNLTAMVLLLLPVSRSLKWLNLTCVLAIVGIWIEKGMGLVIPGFIPTPLGAVVEYSPSLNETLVCLGIWAFGLLCYTIFLRMAVPILQGRLTKANEGLSEEQISATLAVATAKA
ncbi:MAG: cyclic nucleotide-binding domain-containing protein [Verrucomicrobia bacterium]|nr:MAG: cyclic nucleotide-binding domain-containing protein [Verrucomicrobiota bacterium]